MLIQGAQRRGNIDQLTGRERVVLELIAQGYSNAAICRELWLSDKTVESHVRSIFRKLDLFEDGTCNRRVRAVLAWLEAAEAPADVPRAA